MTHTKILLVTAVTALTLGALESTETPFPPETPRAQSDILIVGNDPTPTGAKTEENARAVSQDGKGRRVAFRLKPKGDT
jgi:hypothetical protein